MVTRKKKSPPFNYVISKYKMKYDGSIWRVWLEEAKEFYSPKDLKEITYWENGECFTVEKIQNEV